MAQNVPASVPFRRLVGIEARSAVRPLHITMLVLLAGIGALVAAWLPIWPETVFRFFDKVLLLHTWTAIVLGNNLIAIFFFLFWFGLLDILRIYILPLEGEYLDLWLSKPVTRSSYMLAKVLPSFAVLTVFGILAAAAHGLAMFALGQDYDVLAYAGTIAATIGFVLVMLAAANVALLYVRDSFAALLVGFAIFIACFIPSLVYLYRPDAYAAAPWLADLLVFPTNLVWHPDWAAAWGVPLGLAFAGLALLLVLLAGALLQGRDVD